MSCISKEKSPHLLTGAAKRKPQIKFISMTTTSRKQGRQGISSMKLPPNPQQKKKEEKPIPKEV